jgi:hypothetical protein
MLPKHALNYCASFHLAISIIKTVILTIITFLLLGKDRLKQGGQGDDSRTDRRGIF